MRLKIIVQNGVLVTVSIVIAVVFGEICLRWFIPIYDYSDRCLLFSSPAFKLYSGGSVRYFPKVQIREVAVYADKIEYDVNYRTNNIGFIDSMDYIYESVPDKRYYAFVGDSFTAGVNGGTPWVPGLRANKINAEVYNFGVAGTGFEHFYRVLHDMKGRVAVTNIVLVVITDDFYRAYWHPIIMNDTISFCNESGDHKLCQPIPIASTIPYAASVADIREISRKKYKEIRARIRELNSSNNFRSKLESFLEESSIYFYSKVAYDRYKRQSASGDITDAVAWIRKIKDDYPSVSIQLIHLPQKYEVNTKKYYINIAEQVAVQGVSYFPALEKCNWSMDMFYTRDGHPNQRGYDNISECVAGYLFE
jgi:hypothetical protein